MSADRESLHRLFLGSGGYPRFEEAEYQAMFRQASRLSVPGQRVLEMGCGVGYVGEKLKRMGHHVTGVDPLVEAIVEAIQERRIDDGYVGDLERVRFPEDNFDVVLCFGVLLYFFDLRGIFAEISRLLSPGGQILIFDHHRRNPYVWLHFHRPDWVDRFLEGRSNIPRRALDEQMIREGSPRQIEWAAPSYMSLYTQHPNWKINAVHRVARTGFGLIRSVTTQPWTANALVMVGKKVPSLTQIFSKR